MCGTVGNGSFRFCKEADHLRSKDIGKYTNQFRHDQRAGDTKADTLFDTLVLLCAQILPGKGTQALAEAHHRQESEAFQLGVGTAAVDGIRTEGENIVKEHGSSDAKAFKNAIRQAIDYAGSGAVYEIAEAAKAYAERKKAAKETEKPTQA